MRQIRMIVIVAILALPSWAAGEDSEPSDEVSICREWMEYSRDEKLADARRRTLESIDVLGGGPDELLGPDMIVFFDTLEDCLVEAEPEFVAIRDDLCRRSLAPRNAELVEATRPLSSTCMQETRRAVEQYWEQ